MVVAHYVTIVIGHAAALQAIVDLYPVFSPAKIEGIGEGIFWVGLVSTSTVLAPSQSHFKDKSALKGLSLKYAGENTVYLIIFVMSCCLNLGFQDLCGRSSVQQAPEPASDKLAEPLSE